MDANKDTYDEFLQFSRITHENWLLPDQENYIPIGVTEEEWIGPFLSPKLRENVPQEVVRLFEVARGCMIYSWFFFPLATLGFEQLTRVGEFAIRARCRLLKRESDIFGKNLRTLCEGQVISVSDESRWQAMRRLRNCRSHPNGLMLIDPGQAVGCLQTAAELINQLFATSGNTSA